MKLERFIVKSKTYKIGGEDFEVWPLSIEDLPLLTKLAKEETKGEAMKEMIKITLERGDPELGAAIRAGTKISLEILTDLSNAIIEINGLQDKVDTKKLVGEL